MRSRTCSFFVSAPKSNVHPERQLAFLAHEKANADEILSALYRLHVSIRPDSRVAGIRPPYGRDTRQHSTFPPDERNARQAWLHCTARYSPTASHPSPLPISAPDIRLHVPLYCDIHPTDGTAVLAQAVWEAYDD